MDALKIKITKDIQIIKDVKIDSHVIGYLFYLVFTQLHRELFPNYCKKIFGVFTVYVTDDVRNVTK